MAKRKTIAVPPQTRAMLARVVAKLKPPPAMTLSQWADKERRLSQGASALPGRWRTDKAPYQRGMMDAISDPHVRKVVVKSCAQIGKTDALVLNTIGYYMNYNPSPIMVLQPTLDMGQGFSKEKLSPMLRDTPCLRGLVDKRNEPLDLRNYATAALEITNPVLESSPVAGEAQRTVRRTGRRQVSGGI